MPAAQSATRQSTAVRQTEHSAASHVLKKLSPAAPGAKRLSERYGDALPCVRYRADRRAGQRLTTVELVVDRRPLPPLAKLRIAYEETELRSKVKAAGGQWDAESKLWRLPKSAVRKLKLESRLVPESG